MAIYAVGDLQGCLDEFKRVLDKVCFDAERDQVWLTGDLVNRGPQSLEALRFVKNLGACVVSVLGNHDLHLLAVAMGVRALKYRDTLNEILSAPDRDELLDWLRHRPLLYYHSGLQTVLVHAGLAPSWDLAKAGTLAREVEHALCGINAQALLQNLFGPEPNYWSDSLTGWARLRAIVNFFTRVRFCDRQGCMDPVHKGPPGTQPHGLLPWFEVPGRRSQGVRIVVGHWSALGFYHKANVVALDTGCVWGGTLTALRLDTQDVAPVILPCKGKMQPAAFL